MGGMILMNVLNVQPKVKTKEAFTMENKKDKVALNDELLDKVSGGVDDEFRPNPNEGKTFYHVFHGDIVYGCSDWFYSEDEDPLVCSLCGMPMHSFAE